MKKLWIVFIAGVVVFALAGQCWAQYLKKEPMPRLVPNVPRASAGLVMGMGSSSFEKVSKVMLTGVTAAADFATSGQFKVGFVATDESGNPILVSSSLSPSSGAAPSSGAWLNIVAKGSQSSNISCAVTAPASSSCAYDLVSTLKPSGGKGTTLAAVMIDDSGSMAYSDPNNDRGLAARAYLDSVCASDQNLFGLFDFGGGGNVGFAETRDLITADSMLGPLPGHGHNSIPYYPCSRDNVSKAQAAIASQLKPLQSTPLYESVLELCGNIAKNRLTGSLAGYSPAILVLSDGQPNADDKKAEALNCLKSTEILACTVGLGPGSELDPNVDQAAVDALRDLAHAGNCVYAAATSPEAMKPIFEAVGNGVSAGQNFAIFGINPIPASGTIVKGTLNIGTTATDFSFVVP